MVAVIVAICYLAIFIAIVIAELAFVARRVPGSDARLITNFGLAMLNMAVVSMIPVGIVATATYGEFHRIG